MPTTAHSSTAGWAVIACSTSMLEMFSPPETMMSLPRSRSSMLPSGCHTARSPEWNHPPANARSVAAGSSKYPLMTLFPRMTTSPMVAPSRGTSFMSPSTTRTRSDVG
jgi:hypothetical protein